ncbi:carboxypeptidase regulatory-like domain-containing protein [Pseudoxanthomonas wuyuanensis]
MKPSLQLLVAVLLGLAVLIAWWRLLQWQRRALPGQRTRGGRRALLWLGQPLLAALLYLALLPPRVETEAGTLVVLTARATAAQLGEQRGSDALVALPEAPRLAAAEPVPDLATALRRHPDSRRLRIVGAGLPPRDRDAARGSGIDYLPAPLLRGIVELQAPRRVAAGDAFRIHGRVHSVAGGSVELIDPGAQRVDRLALPEDGRFVLSGASRVAGLATFRLRLRDAKQQLLEEIPLPLQTIGGAPVRVLLLAGAPGPELKYLRRWASDAGLQLHTQISVGGGLQLGDAPLALNAANLRGFDLLVMDERAWNGLGTGAHDAVAEALREGLGVLLRATGPLAERDRRQLRALGLDLDSGRESASVRLPQSPGDEAALRARLGPGSREAPLADKQPPPKLPELSRRVLRIGGDDVVPLLRDGEGKLLAGWRAEGRGRIAVWTLTDSFKLVLSGRDDRHAELWSQAFATLARGAALTVPAVDDNARQGQRVAICGLNAEGDADVIAPDGSQVPLRIDAATGQRACAAFWPQHSGWHRLQQGEEQPSPFFVHASDTAPALQAADLREAMLRLTGERPAASTAVPSDRPGHRGSPWPWFLAWLLAAAALWWFERSRLGRPSSEPPL